MKKYSFEDLLNIVERLRSPGGCPWDIEQTHESIKNAMIEESYEVIEAIEEQDNEKMADESGDLLLQVVFHAQIGKEKGEYTIDDVIDAVCEKMIHRHPHVFGDAKADTAEEVLDKWDEIKRKDREQKTISQELKEVTPSLPALMRAKKIQSKAKKHGFVFNSPNIAAESVSGLLKVLAQNEEPEIAEDYIGRILFDIVSVSCLTGIDPELALKKRTEKFIKEFERYEEKDET
ncbi:MAG: nucleoside triphosphate pyrophosphohydrolase [Clostridia bacterium]|nr:nucleoside triphosphate pyrophosphohydrolase [Clostridia bacterium]